MKMNLKIFWSRLSMLLMFGVCTLRGSEQAICVIIPSYNNLSYYHKNLESVLCQQYDNYRVIYIDDCSPDGTGTAVQTYLQQHPLGERVQLVRNRQRMLAVHNIYRAVHDCPDDEIILLLDGDDWLSHSTVLRMINDAYSANSETWMTSGTNQRNSNGELIQLEPHPDDIRYKRLRGIFWGPAQPMTFRAWLFKQIRLADLVSNSRVPDFCGQFFPALYNLAFAWPMLEMAGPERHVYIKQPIYIFNDGSPIGDGKIHRDWQWQVCRQLQWHYPYNTLLQRPVHAEMQQLVPIDAQQDLICLPDNASYYAIVDGTQGLPDAAELDAFVAALARTHAVAFLFNLNREQVERHCKVVEPCPGVVGWLHKLAPELLAELPNGCLGIVQVDWFKSMTKSAQHNSNVSYAKLLQQVLSSSETPIVLLCQS